MKKNMGRLDQTLRIWIAVLIGVLYLTGVLSGTWAIVLVILAVVFAITGFLRFCLFYLPFRINTIGKEEREARVK